MPHLKKYLVIRASGGLSNRLQAIIGGIAFCLLTGRTLCVDWRDGLYSDDFSNVFPQWFQIQGVDTATCHEVEEAFSQGAKLAPSFWKEYLHEAIAVEYLFSDQSHMHAEQLQKSSYDITASQLFEQADTAPDILVHWGWNLNTVLALTPALQRRFPEYAGLDGFEMARTLLQKHIQPTQIITESVQHFYAENFPTAPVGIHIRHSDMQSPLPRMLEMLSTVAKPEERIFLCTDNELVEKMVRRVYPHCITRTKTFQGVNVPLHCYVPGISNVQKGFDAVVEMLLLAQCKHIIHYKRSSFARISILLSSLSPEHVHSVQ